MGQMIDFRFRAHINTLCRIIKNQNIRIVIQPAGQEDLLLVTQLKELMGSRRLLDLIQIICFSPSNLPSSVISLITWFLKERRCSVI